MTISTISDGPLFLITTFLGKPTLGVSKKFQFAELTRDSILLRNLQKENLPVLSFLKNREINHIDPTLGLIAEYDRIHAIFREIITHTKKHLSIEQYQDTSTKHQSRSIAYYIKLDEIARENHDHSICVLAKTLRDQIPTIPSTPNDIRVWFADLSNQRTFLEITNLNMSLKQLICIPEEISLLRNLKYLYLSNNRISTLPETFVNLINLTNLYLSNNRISVLPQGFVNLINLTHLGLSNNNISTLPDAFGNLVLLKFLYLSNNRISALPNSFGNLKNLYNLLLSNNRISTLPDAFGNLELLKFLYLSNNRISTLLDTFGNLRTLDTLSLDHNNIHTLPQTFKNLRTLRSLNFSQNNISSLPSKMRQFLNSINSFTLGPQQIKDRFDEDGRSK